MKNKRMKYYASCIMHCALCIVLAGCIEEYEADIAKEDSNLLVVEGTICSGKLNKFYLSRAQAIDPSKTPQMITDARVSVRGSDGSEHIANNSYYGYGYSSYGYSGYSGYYMCQIDTLYPDVEYYLHIEADGEVYESEPQKPLPTEKIAEVEGVQNTPESNIDVLVTPSEPYASNQAHYYSWTYDETWEVHPDYITGVYYDTEKKKPVDKTNQFPLRGWKDASGSTVIVGASTNYDGQHIRGLKLYDIDRTHERMYYRYSGLIHQRAISKAEYEYELAQRQAGSEMGGLFTPQPSALPTNIRCLTSRRHVIGYVGCSLNTSEYRFFLHPKDFSTFHYPHPDTRLWLNNPTEADCMRLVLRGMYLCEWDEPLAPGDVLRTAWAYLYQLDVRYHGAYVEEPEFWSWKENRSY